MRTIDWTATLRAAAIATAMLVVGALAASAVSTGDQTAWAIGYLAWTALALFTSGLVAAAARLDLPVLHGATAAVIAAVVAMVASLLLGTAPGGGIAAVRGVAIIAAAASLGGAGGLVADWRHRHRHRRRQEVAQKVSAERSG